MAGDIVVNLRGGNYFFSTPLEFTPEDSGRNGFQIIYRAYKKEVPVISGGVVVTNWTLDHGRERLPVRERQRQRPGVRHVGQDGCRWSLHRRP